MRILDKVFQKTEKIITRKVVGETILVPIAGNLADMQRIFGLNQVAEYIWERLDGHASLNDIYNSILNDFEIEPAQAKKDFFDFISELKTARLII